MNAELSRIVAFSKLTADGDLALYGALLNLLIGFYSVKNSTFEEYSQWVVDERKRTQEVQAKLDADAKAEFLKVANPKNLSEKIDDERAPLLSAAAIKAILNHE